MHIGLWDILLLVVVSLMATAIAYIHNARVKALLLMLPIPFTFANLSLGSPVDVTNVLGCLVLYLFTQGVRILHVRLGVGIVAAIGISASMYCLIGWAIASTVPKTEQAFWIAAAGVLVVGLVLHFASEDVDEPGHRSALPIWQKLPVIAMVISVLVIIKTYLQGFMTLFPMVGVIAAYESRCSLATTCKKVGALMFTMLPMIMVMRITQRRFGLGIGPSLAFGWVTYLACLFPVAWDVWRKVGVGVEDRQAAEEVGICDHSSL